MEISSAQFSIWSERISLNPEFIEKVKKVRLNTSSCQVYMGIREGETIDDIGDLIFYSEAKEFKTEELLVHEYNQPDIFTLLPETKAAVGQTRDTR